MRYLSGPGFVALALAAVVGLAAAPTQYRQLPDPKLTPGAVLAVTVQDICTPGYAKRVRNVPEAVKRQIYREYGVTSHRPREFEVDHLISLELGGSNDVRNLWPQPYRLVVDGLDEGAHTKDALEDRLHALVCAGTVDLKQAQKDIAVDWIAAYKKYVGPLPKAKLTPLPPPAPGPFPKP